MTPPEKMTPANPGVPYPNTYWILPKRLLAGEHPIEISDDLSRTRLAGLLHSGIRTFVNLTEEREGESYHRLLREIADGLRVEISYVRVPIVDRGIPSAQTMRHILDLVDHSLAEERPAFVHCFAGLGRTGTVVGCYLRRHNLALKENLLATIAELRRYMPVGPECSPHTPEQVWMAQNWSEVLGKP